MKARASHRTFASELEAQVGPGCVRRCAVALAPAPLVVDPLGGESSRTFFSTCEPSVP